jgi:outer membrane protein OmpA-like peptidoglycan-associated protein
MRRAQVVADYLINVWRVNERRVKIRTTGLPDNPSLSEVDTVEGARENQRVEIMSDDYSILAPVMLLDSLYLRPAGTIRFFPPTVDTLRTNAWTIDLQIGDSLVKGVAKGYGVPPTPIDVTIQNRPNLDFRAPVNAVATMTLQDTLFEVFGTYQSTPVVVRQEGTFREERNVVRGRVIDEYNLLLFSFDSSGIMDFTQQSATIMRDRITPESTVRVIGHTDKIGLPPYNRALSFRRAEVAAGLLGLVPNDVQGLGEKNLLYDNTHPEGRYYCRTVTVIVETPVTDEEAGKQAQSSSRRLQNQ